MWRVQRFQWYACPRLIVRRPLIAIPWWVCGPCRSQDGVIRLSLPLYQALSLAFNHARDPRRARAAVITRQVATIWGCPGQVATIWEGSGQVAAIDHELYTMYNQDTRYS